MNSAKVIINEEDRSFFVESLLQGVGAVLLKTKRGKYGISEELYTSEVEFEKHYGGVSIDFPGVLLAKRALRRGAKLRVVKVGHHAVIANPVVDAVKAALDASGADDFGYSGDVAPVQLFTLTPKYAGADYNNLVAKITDASNGVAGSFNIEINHLIDTNISEKYENLSIPGEPTAANSHYLDEIISKSKLVDVTYFDTAAAILDPVRPENGTWAFIGGTNGGAVVDADYTGDPGGTGLYHLSNYEDFDFFCALDNESAAFANAAVAYAESRKDCRGLIHIPNSSDSSADVIAFKTPLIADSRFVSFWCGGLKVRNPYVSSDVAAPLDISELGDVLGVHCKSAAEFGPWYSAAGLQRGQIFDAIGVVNNFAPGGPARLDSLAQRQINAVVQVGSNIFLKGNFSAQQAASRKSFNSVVGLLIYIKKALRPTLERYLEQPNDFRTFRELYNEVEPFLSSLVGNEKRALLDYQWRGDQFANTEAELKINNPVDLAAGKYKVELWLKEVVSLQEFTLTIISAPAGVTFEDNIN